MFEAPEDFQEQSNALYHRLSSLFPDAIATNRFTAAFELPICADSPLLTEYDSQERVRDLTGYGIRAEAPIGVTIASRLRDGNLELREISIPLEAPVGNEELRFISSHDGNYYQAEHIGQDAITPAVDPSWPETKDHNRRHAVYSGRSVLRAFERAGYQLPDPESSRATNRLAIAELKNSALNWQQIEAFDVVKGMYQNGLAQQLSLQRSTFGDKTTVRQELTAALQTLNLRGDTRQSLEVRYETGADLDEALNPVVSEVLYTKADDARWLETSRHAVRPAALLLAKFAAEATIAE